MKTVWVVEFKGYYDYLNKICSTREKAEKYVLEENKNRSKFWSDFHEDDRNEKRTIYEFYCGFMCDSFKVYVREYEVD